MGGRAPGDGARRLRAIARGASWLLAIACVLPGSQALGREPQQGHRPPSLETLPDDRFGGLVRLGHAIITNTPKHAGRYVGNQLSCTNCHLDAGRKPNAAPFWAAWVMYPSWRAKNNRVNTFDDRVQQCFRFSLNGVPPAPGSIELQAIAAYAFYLAQGATVSKELPGRGFPVIGKTGQDPNPEKGAAVYARYCQACHGPDGAGAEAVPPLWGMRSYNKGAGMFTVLTAAGFIKANMPPDKPSLSDQEALDVAAFVNSHLRPPDPRRGLVGYFDK